MTRRSVPRARPPGRAAVGRGRASCHHGEILQGVFLDERGRACAGLVTLPMTGPGTRAEFTPDPHGTPGPLTVTPADRTKALRAATLALAECHRAGPQAPPPGGVLRLGGTVPLGLGMGSSSSDVVAAVRAVADAYGRQLAPEAVARLAVAAEKATDPLMLDDRPRLFAQREGRVLETFGEALPPAVVVGCALDEGRPVDTLSLPSRPSGPDDLAGYERLRRLLRRAVGDADVELLGHIATESARLSQRVLPRVEFDRLVQIAERTGATGVQIAHSGSVAGLLFDPTAPGLDARLRDCARALHHDGIPVTRTFTTFPTGEEFPHGPTPGRGDGPTGPDTAGRRLRLPAL
ncbi:GHMP kinase [Streptomyces sp. NPDC049906]|uniref:GHMP family kinase ATP-binding protein n=1 Tax=Streptomyces sp. NPDC049906 TaxID=3155656 RepID=UPI00342CFDC3